MTSITVDDSLGGQLADLEDRAELRDQGGRVVGYFLTDEAYKQMIYDLMSAQVSEEELERRMHEPGDRPLEQILKSLENA